MEFSLTVTEGENIFDFRLIIVHLKAYSDASSQARREAAIQDLKDYIDTELAKGGEEDFILTGDFNDHLEDAEADNVFQVMLDDPNTYTFLTLPLAGVQGSYIGLNEPNLIDHFCVTSDALDEYGTNGNAAVLYLDNQNNSYESTVSDHRPVLAQFAFSNGSGNQTDYTEIADIHSNFNSYNGQTVTIKGVVTIGSGILTSSYTSAYVQDSSDTGINVYYSSAAVSEMDLGDLVEVTGEVSSYNGLNEIMYHTHSRLAQNQEIPAAYDISTNLINDIDAQPGRWVKIKGEIESISAGPHINMMVNDGSGAGNVYFDPDAGLDVSDFSVGDSIQIEGVKTVYNNSGQIQPAYENNFGVPVSDIIFSRNEIVNSYQLFQNYPNPFNPQTVISFSIPAGKSESVTLTVFNAIGQKISVLVNKNLQAGSYSYIFNAEDLASGIYFYRLQAGNFIQNRKMLLMR